MKKITAVMAATGLLVMANSALAGKDSGLYIGASLASSSYDVVNSGGDLDETDTSYKVFGGYNFGLVPFFDIAAEVSYYDLGAISVDKKDYSSTALAASALGAFNFGPFGVFAKYGFAQLDSDISDVDGTEDAYGIGARFQIGSIALRAEYELFDLADDVDLDYASLGASWTF
ncbi:outer membrane beta-barrel protein [Agaribacterium haliotis]|uniref:outer membrane beta-barrel protein n=1 Tax=Agaribacterium haliotis TaxID=2013869 RepID=UPI000BB54A61|nr:outer membrane beta-barrel protein [Agaribacterium haliotis]